eukprot:m.367075 g.367075  ORF g.367075 m.367075 type:complete len:537 (+) comp28099_c0_seq2:2660-4270(+)
MDGAARAALAIVKEHFGEACCMVYEVLIARESTLKQVVDGTGLPIAQTRESITWLLQHDLITFNPPPPTPFGGKPAPNVYRTILWRVLVRARIPRYLHYTGSKYGEVAEAIIQTIALHGRVRLKSIITAVRDETPEVNPATVKQTLQELLAQHLIHGRDGTADPDVTQLDASSFTVDAPPREFWGSPPPAGEPDVSGSKRRLSSVTSPLASAAKRSRLDSLSVTDPPPDSPTRPSSERYFAINTRQFHRCLFLEWAAAFISKTVDPVCGEVLEALFATALLGDSFAGEKSRTITIAEIREKLPSGRFTDDELDNHVEALELFGSGFVSRPAGSAAYLQLNYSVMRDLARYLAVEKMVETKCGEECARLFRLVRTKRYLEQKKVKELALMGAFKDTKVSLNKLFKEDFLMMQEVPKQADRVPSKCVYVWACDMNRITTMVLFQCYKAQANLSARVAVERKAYKLLRAKQEKQATNPSEHADIQRAKADSEAIEKIEAKLEKLEHAGLETDELVMLLRDFDEISPLRRHEALLPRPIK